MLKNEYVLANIGADTAENEQQFAENSGHRVRGPDEATRSRQEQGRIGRRRLVGSAELPASQTSGEGFGISVFREERPQAERSCVR